ncbi:MAG: ThiF family adenylyltransferase, partial [Epsilonproteobacteria bacterium]|nr:ThiF family adenylyltransferase [Campylobacterota bacterium]
RKKIDSFAKAKNIPWIYASVEETRGQVGVFRKTSFEIFATKAHEVKGQLPPMVNLIGSIASMSGLKCLIGECKEVLYYVDFSEDLEIKKFSF